MNYIQEARNYLKHFRDLQISVDIIDRNISKIIIKAGPRYVAGMSYDNEKVQSGSHDDTLNILFELQRLKECREETSNKLTEINKILEELEKDYVYYGQVLRKWYLERIPKENIAEQIGYSSRSSIYSLEGKAIRVFAIRLFGIDALKVI